MQQAEELSNAGKHSEAAAKYEELVKKFPQVPSVPEANFRAGFAHYLAGEYDEAIAAFKRVIDTKNLPPELAQLAELSLSKMPQVISAKAEKLKPEDPKRKAAFEEAVKEFDAYLAKYPNSEEAESATYGKALALFQLTKYDDAIAALRGNLTKFAQSPTIQDSQYLLALVLATVAGTEKAKTNGVGSAGDAQFEEGEKLLRDIVAKRQNFALMNDAQFQIGELLLARAQFMSDPAQKQDRADTFSKAIEAYRNVASKETVVAAQKARIQQFADLRTKYGTAKDKVNFERFKRLVDKETEKLAQVEGSPDMTLTAKIKTGIAYFSQEKWDETRVLFSQLQDLGLLETTDDKKEALYSIAMSYAAENVVDKAVEQYNAFMTAHKGDPIAENLPLMMGAMFLSPKVKNADKAIQYFSEGIAMYPKGKLLGAMVLARAGAQIELKKFGEASEALQQTLAGNPPKNLAVDAEFYLGTIDTQTGKLPDAVKVFKGVREKYPGTPQAEQSHFQIGQIDSEINPKEAIPELQAFFQKFPKSQFTPAALYALGKSQTAVNQNAEALNTYKKLETEFPKSEPAPFSYFDRAKILSNEQKYDDCLAVMKEFIAKYPDSASLFEAYDFMAQILGSQNKGPDAIAAYEEFVQKRPKDRGTPDALVKLAGLWKAYTDSQGPYLAIGEDKRAEWKKGIEKSTADAERLVAEFPESQQVAKALNILMEVQRLQQQVKLKSPADVEKYFADFAQKFANKPGTRAKILFTLAAFDYDKDKAKAMAEMQAAYKPDLKFAPEDLDLYGQALIDAHKLDEAIAVYKKLDGDFKINGDPKTAPREAQEAHAIVLAGLGKALQEKGDPASKEQGGKLYSELEKNYPWSPKMLEVNYGVALALHDKNQDDEAIKRLGEVIKAPKASAELRAKSMLLLGKIHEANRRFELAIDNYIKISLFFGGVPKIASEGLWLGGQLLERQATGDIPMPTPTPKPASTPKPATPQKKK